MVGWIIPDRFGLNAKWPHRFMYLCKEGGASHGKLEAPLPQHRCVDKTTPLRQSQRPRLWNKHHSLCWPQRTHLRWRMRARLTLVPWYKCEMGHVVAISTQGKVIVTPKIPPGLYQTGEKVRIQLHAVHENSTFAINTPTGLKWENI